MPYRVTSLNGGNIICVSYLPKLNGKGRFCLFQWYGLLLFALGLRSGFINSYVPKVAHLQCHLYCDIEDWTNLWAVHFYASHWNGQVEASAKF